MFRCVLAYLGERMSSDTRGREMYRGRGSVDNSVGGSPIGLESLGHHPPPLYLKEVRPPGKSLIKKQGGFEVVPEIVRARQLP